MKYDKEGCLNTICYSEGIALRLRFQKENHTLFHDSAIKQLISVIMGSGTSTLFFNLLFQENIALPKMQTIN